MVMATLFAAYSHPTLFDHYYSNSISLVVSPSSSLYPIPLSNKNSENGMFPSGPLEHNQVNLLQNTNVPFLWKLKEIDSVSMGKNSNINIQSSNLVLPSKFLRNEHAFLQLNLYEAQWTNSMNISPIIGDKEIKNIFLV